MAQDISHLRTLVAAEMQAVDALILQQLEQSNAPLIPQLSRHILKAGGKRLRPILTLLSAKLCGYAGGGRDVVMAASVEFIHTATLLHDDVVDESSLRRGEPTANAIWSNSASVLVGDFLLAKAFQMMVGDGSLKALKLLSDTSATLSEGEVLQLTSARNLETNRKIYMQIIHAKTASLFATAAEIGAVIAGNTAQRNALKKYGEALGLAFQIVDDALDYSADSKQLGKAAGDDFREGKITLPIIIAYEKGTKDEQEFWQHTLSHSAHADGKNLQKALALLAKHHAIEESLKTAEEQANLAIQALSIFPDSALKTALVTLANFTTHRQH
jgi:octaprenyl-diphosphate synthase